MSQIRGLVGKVAPYALLILAAGTAIWIVVIFVRSFSETDPTVKASIIAGVGAVAAALWTQTRIRKREREARLYDKKLGAYQELVNLYFDMIGQNRQQGGPRNKGRSVTQRDLQKAMMNCKKAFIMWASADFIREWNHLEIQNDEGHHRSDLERTLMFDSILRLIRKDLGHDDSTLPAGSLIATILVTSDKKRAMAD